MMMPASVEDEEPEMGTGSSRASSAIESSATDETPRPPDTRVELFACWESLDSQLAFMAIPPQTEQLTAPVAALHAPWTVSFAGRSLRLGVGPAVLEAAGIHDALETFHHLDTSITLALAADTGASESVGARLLLGRPVPRGTSETLRHVMADPLRQLLGPAAHDRLEISSDREGLMMRLAQPLLPEVLDQVVALFVSGGVAMLVEAPDGNLPPGGVEQLLTSARSLESSIVRRGQLDVLNAGLDPGLPVGPKVLPTGKPQVPRQFGPLHIVPFRPNGRPTDEAERPGTGCSESLCFLSSGPDREHETLWILFNLAELKGSTRDSTTPIEVRLSASFMPSVTSGLPAPVPVPEMTDVPVQPHRVVAASHPRPALQPTRFEYGRPSAYVAEIVPYDLLPRPQGSRWCWEEADPLLRAATPDGQDPFTFAHLFKQRLRIDLAVVSGARDLALRSTEVDVFDVDRFGTLYERLITHLVTADTRAQADAGRRRRIYQAYHPWYPVLAIGLAKARLYMRAVLEDVSLQRRNLADPGWLMRVGLYLEFLTCLGIMEAVRDEYPDLLTPAERRCFEESPAFAEIQRQIDPAAWKNVWAHHTILFANSPLTAAGPVDFRNLMQKQLANLAFLEVHHADLKHAIELAGPNLTNAQQTWHRVFRDAERAVLDTSNAVFPEFRHLRPAYHHFVYWHEQGNFPFPSGRLLPVWLTATFGDRDGLYPTAARRYRESMNEVAAWAKQRGLMDYSGAECVPRSASLIEALVAGEDERFATLQAGDGYGPPLAATRQGLVGVMGAGVDIVAGLLRTIEIFEPLTAAETWQLAHQVKRRHCSAGEPILVQGQPAASLYLIEYGTVEVITRQPDNSDLVVDHMTKGDVFGEYSLLTGQATSATVRAVNDVVVHVLPKTALRPIIEARPEIVVELSVLLAARRTNRQSKSDDYLFGDSGPPNAGVAGRLASLMRTFLLN
jgi:hypothetical protein